MKKLKAIWTLIKAKHYAVVIADSEQEIGWMLGTLRQADKEQS